MKAYFSILLVGIILICPSFCRAAEASCCAEHGDAAGTEDRDAPESPSIPGTPADCICAGAIKDVKGGNATLELTGSLPPLFPVFLPSVLHADPSLLQFLSRNGAPPGLAERPSPLRIHVLLMTFRC